MRKYHITNELANELFTKLKEMKEVPKDCFLGMKHGDKKDTYGLTTNKELEIVLDNKDLVGIKGKIDKAVVERKVKLARDSFPTLINKELEKKQKEDLNEFRKQKVAEAFNKIEQGVNDVFTAENYANYLSFCSKIHHYSLNNQMLIYIQNPDAGLVMSFKKWKELGRHVKKGQKAIEILAPIQKKVETPARDDTGRVVLDEDGKQVTKQSSYTYYKFVPVFADNQTEGEPLPRLIRDMEGDSEVANELINKITSISRAPITYATGETDPSFLNKGLYGYYHRVLDKIVIRDDMSVNQKAKVLVHEYVHSYLHKDTFSDSRNKKELEAESVAFIICDYYGFDTSEFTFGYIAMYKGREDLKEVLFGINKKSKEILTLLDSKK